MEQKNIYLKILLSFISLTYFSSCTNKQPEQFAFEKEWQKADSLDLLGAFTEEVQLCRNIIKIAGTTYNYEQQAIAYCAISKLSRGLNDLKMGRLYADSCKVAATKSGSNLALAYACYADASIQFHLGNTDAAVSSCFEGLRVLNKDKKDLRHKTIEGHLYYWLYFISSASFGATKDVEKGLEYINKAISAAEQSEHALKEERLATYYGSKGSTYGWIVEFSGNRTYIDTLIHYSLLGESICLNNRTKTSSWSLARIYLTICQAYSYFYKPGDNYAQSQFEKYITKIEKLPFPSKADSVSSLAELYIRRSEYAFDRREIGIAEQFALKALSLGEQRTDTFSNKTDYYYSFLSEIYAAKNDFKQAFTYLNKAGKIKNKVTAKERQENIVKNEILFDTERKEATIKLLQAQSSIRLILIIVTVAGAALFLLLYLFYRRSAKYKIDAIAEEQERIEAENKLLLADKALQDKELMISSLQLKHKIDTIKELQEHIETSDAQQSVQKIINSAEILDEELQQIDRFNKEIHPEFTKRLNEISSKSLSPLYLKYCYCIYLKMDTKQIAALMNVEPHTVRITKYRIKQRLGLDKSQDLANFLQQLG